jgi:hypothetical protein
MAGHGIRPLKPHQLSPDVAFKSRSPLWSSEEGLLPVGKQHWSWTLHLEFVTLHTVPHVQVWTRAHSVLWEKERDKGLDLHNRTPDVSLFLYPRNVCTTAECFVMFDLFLCWKVSLCTPATLLLTVGRCLHVCLRTVANCTEEISLLPTVFCVSPNFISPVDYPQYILFFI